MHTFVSILLPVIIILYSGFLLSHIISWGKLNTLPGQKLMQDTRVSVIIPARNEENAIGECIDSIMQQDYPQNLTELIVCDDQSTDSTKEKILDKLNNSSIQGNYIYVSVIPSHKKRAIEAGINASSGQLIIITDADCKMGRSWISSLVSVFENTGAKMLCGPVAFTGEKNLCEKFQGLEMCGLSLLSGAGINAGIPLLCNGANIAYTREVFESIEGFKGIEDMPTGDDTLMLFKINKKYPGSIHFVKNEKALVYTHAQPNWKALLEQRIRWASKGFRSKNRLNSIVSSLVFFSNFGLLVYTILAFIYPISIPILVSCIILKSLIDFLLLTFATVFFRKSTLLFIFPVAQIITIFYTSLVGLIAPYGRYQWKGRNY